MADKFISAYSKSTAPSKTDKLITEASTDGVYLHQDREQLHTLYTGEQIDSASGVDLLLKAGASASITVTAGTGAVAFSKVVTMAGQLQTAAVIRAAAGIRESGNLEFLTKGNLIPMMMIGPATLGRQGFVMPAIVKGAAAVTPKIVGFTQIGGDLGGITTTITLMTAAGDTYSASTAAITWANLGEDQTIALQSTLATALASFLSGEGVACTVGDIFTISHDGGNVDHLAVTVEVVHT